MKHRIFQSMLVVLLFIIGCETPNDTNIPNQPFQHTKLTLVTSTNNIIVDSLISFSCSTDPDDSVDTELEWHCGVSFPTQYTINHHKTNYRFQEAGLYTIILILKNIRTQDTLGYLDTVISVLGIEQDTNAKNFQKLAIVSILCKADISYIVKTDSGGWTSKPPNSLSVFSGKIAWSGRSFYYALQRSEVSPVQNDDISVVIQGALNNTFDTLLSISGSHHIHSQLYGYRNIGTEIVYIDMPITSTGNDTSRFSANGFAAKSNTKKIDYSDSGYDEFSHAYFSSRIDSISWNSTKINPSLDVIFHK